MDKLTCPQCDRTRTSVSACRIARSLHLPRPGTAHRTVACRRDHVHLIEPYTKSSYLWSSQNRKWRRVPYHRRWATRPSTVSCNSHDSRPCSAYSISRTACFIRACHPSQAVRTSCNISYVHIRISSSCSCSACGCGFYNVFCIRHRESNVGESARKARPTVATHLVTDVCVMSGLHALLQALHSNIWPWHSLILWSRDNIFRPHRTVV